MQFLVTLLVFSSFGMFMTHGNPTGEYSSQADSYAIAPKLDLSEEVPSDLNLDMVPPAADTAPHIYYMNNAGMAESADNEKPLRIVRREVDSGNDETLLADETVIIGPPSGRPFGVPAVQLGYRPARAYYARRYHKYPWNYH